MDNPVFNEALTRSALERLVEAVQYQHSLPLGDPLKYNGNQMETLFDRLDSARAAHDEAYKALVEYDRIH